MWPDERVVRAVADTFLPARVHVREQAEDFQRLGRRYGASWTPTTLILDSEGNERHRIEGFLPADDFLGQLALGVALVAFHGERFEEAERQFRAVVERFPASDAAAEAQYWAGVSRYKATDDPAALRETARAFERRYQDTSWAKKASVWSRPGN